jgi:cyclophilin family peptidyl-prolyl cis-trans isomerase
MQMDEMKYAVLTEVLGRWKAEILEGFLRKEEIDVVLIEEAIWHVTHTISFAPVRVYVPKASIKRARAVLNTFNENQDDTKEKSGMANKKKIEERLEAERRARQARYIQIAGVGIALILIVVAFWAFGPKQQSQAPAVTESSTQVVSAIPTFDGNIGDPTACDSFADIPTATQYSQPPVKIDKSKQYFATVKMAKGGDFVMQLYPDRAPITVNSFVFLACKGFFNGVSFHRVLEGFMAQGGDPTGTGTGGPGYQFVNENSDLKFDKAGVVAMANAGADTNGSQFFITFGPTEQLNGGYTIFGQIVQGMDVVNGITRRDPQTNPTFSGDAMESVTITVK